AGGADRQRVPDFGVDRSNVGHGFLLCRVWANMFGNHLQITNNLEEHGRALLRPRLRRLRALRSAQGPVEPPTELLAPARYLLPPGSRSRAAPVRPHRWRRARAVTAASRSPAAKQPGQTCLRYARALPERAPAVARRQATCARFRAGRAAGRLRPAAVAAGSLEPEVLVAPWRRPRRAPWPWPYCFQPGAVS